MYVCFIKIYLGYRRNYDIILCMCVCVGGGGGGGGVGYKDRFTLFECKPVSYFLHASL